MTKVVMAKSVLDETLKTLKSIEGAHGTDRLMAQETADSLESAMAKARPPLERPVRMWINQPSTLQPLHALHGTNVLAVQEYDDTMTIYFLSGTVVSQQALRSSLSPGWVSN